MEIHQKKETEEMPLRRRSSVLDEFENEMRKSIKTFEVKARDFDTNKDL